MSFLKKLDAFLTEHVGGAVVKLTGGMPKVPDHLKAAPSSNDRATVEPRTGSRSSIFKHPEGFHPEYPELWR
jgi:hypothetical protein